MRKNSPGLGSFHGTYGYCQVCFSYGAKQRDGHDVPVGPVYTSREIRAKRGSGLSHLFLLRTHSLRMLWDSSLRRFAVLTTYVTVFKQIADRGNGEKTKLRLQYAYIYSTGDYSRQKILCTAITN